MSETESFTAPSFESKKRKADEDAAKDLTQQKKDPSTSQSTDSEIQPPSKIAKVENGSSDEGKTEVRSIEAIATTGGGGFSAYAKINPFANATASITPSSFGASRAASLAAAARSIDTNADTIDRSSEHVLATVTDVTEVSDSPVRSIPKPAFTMPPPLMVPSPKSPRANPFSSPSPAHNPFMTIEEKPSEVWKEMANDRLSADEVVKGSSILAGSKKESQQRNFHSFGSGSTSAPTTSTALNLNGKSNFDYSGSYSNPSSTRFSAASGAGASSEPIFGQSFASSKSPSDNKVEDDADEHIDDDNADDGGDAETAAPSASMKIVSLPENVVLVTGEEEDECLLQLRGKLYRYTTRQRSAPSSTTIEDATVKETTASTTTSASEKVSIFGSAESLLSASATDTSKAAAFLESVFSASSSSSADSKAHDGKKNSNGADNKHSSLLSDFINSTNEAKSDVECEVVKSISPSLNANEHEWVEVGVGPLKVLSKKFGERNISDYGKELNDNHELKHTYRVVMRREEKKGGTGIKLILNARLDKSTVAARHADKMIRLVCSNFTEDQKLAMGTYLIKLKTVQEADDLLEMIGRYSSAE